MNGDIDLDRVRALRADLSEPDDLAVARNRYRLVRAIETPHPRRRGWLVAAVAGGGSAVLALSVAAVFVIGAPHGGAGPRAAAGGSSAGSPSATTPSAVAATSAGPASPAPPPVDLTVTPVRLAPGQLLYVHGHLEGYSHEMWVDVNGAIALAIRRVDEGRVSIDFSEQDLAQDIANARAALAADGPSLDRPTPAFLAGLPSDPHALLTMLRPIGGNTSKSDRLTVKNTTELLYLVEPLLSPAQRAEFLAALDLIPGVTVNHAVATFAGQPVYSLVFSSPGNYDGLFVNSGTGRIIGDFASVDKAQAMANATQWSYGVATQPGVAP